MTPVLSRALRLWFAILAVYALLIQAVVPAYAWDVEGAAGFEICHDGKGAPADHGNIHGLGCCTLCGPQQAAMPADDHAVIVTHPGPVTASYRLLPDEPGLPAASDFRLPPPRAPPLKS